jgi:hypothetical protein
LVEFLPDDAVEVGDFAVTRHGSFLGLWGWGLIDHKEHEGHEVLKKTKRRVLLRAQGGMAERWGQKNNKSRAYFCLYFSDDCLFCNSHDAILAQERKNEKPTVGFLV